MSVLIVRTQTRCTLLKLAFESLSSKQSRPNGNGGSALGVLNYDNPCLKSPPQRARENFIADQSRLALSATSCKRPAPLQLEQQLQENLVGCVGKKLRLGFHCSDMASKDDDLATKEISATKDYKGQNKRTTDRPQKRRRKKREKKIQDDDDSRPSSSKCKNTQQIDSHQTVMAAQSKDVKGKYEGTKKKNTNRKARTGNKKSNTGNKNTHVDKEITGTKRPISGTPNVNTLQGPNENDEGKNVMNLLDIDRPGKGKEKKGKGKRPPRPNYFVAVRIQDKSVIQKAKDIQDTVIEFNEDLKKACVPLQTLHLTIVVFNATNEKEIDLAKQALASCMPELNRLCKCYSNRLYFEDVGNFNNEVVYINIKSGDAKDLLTEIANVIYEVFKEQGIRLTDKHNTFKPHLTMLKLSRNFNFFREKKIRKIPKEAYKEYVEQSFGTDIVESLLICSMTSKEEDGFYTCVDEAKLSVQSEEEETVKTDANELSDSWEIVSSTELINGELPSCTKISAQNNVKCCTIL